MASSSRLLALSLVACAVSAASAAPRVDCRLSGWSPWGACSASCGADSYKTRSRSVVRAPSRGGAQCMDLEEIKKCTVRPNCPQDCKLAFDDCSQCTQSCGGGTKVCVARVATPPQYGGKPCPSLATPVTRQVKCGNVACPVDCKVGKWGAWAKCTSVCDGTQPLAPGMQSRTRPVLRQPANNGKACPAALSATRACNTRPCKVNCGFTLKAGTCTPCSKKCGGGVRTCESVISREAANGGRACPGRIDDHKCNAKPCPEDCVTTAWSKWSACSKTCGAGKQTRSRSVTRAQLDGGSCPSLAETRPCQARECAVDCKLSDWGAWGDCSRSCGGGVHVRTRSAATVPRFGGKPCGAQKQTLTCRTLPCPEDCQVSSWKATAACPVTCGGGKHTVMREVVRYNSAGGKACPSLARFKPCNTKPCPVDCKFSKKCGPCTQSCGDAPGSRYCDVTVLGLPAGTGKACPSSGKKSCGNRKCPVDCIAEAFGAWLPCTATCGNGISIRRRKLVRAAAHGGKPCPALSDARPCGTTPCAADCVVTPWKPWSICTSSCGGGTQVTQRTVVRRARHGGKACPYLARAQPCGSAPCPANCELSSWGAWSACDRTCGASRKLRYRTVLVEPSAGGKSCPKKLTQHKACSAPPCPVHCQVSAFGNCGRCTKSCGAGKKTCTRRVTVAAAHGGEACPALKDAVWCNLKPCPTDCQLADWGSWGTCSSHCAGGFQKRWRKVLAKPLLGGKGCGTRSEKRACNTFPCPVNCVVSLWGDCTTCSKSCGTGHQTCYRHVTVPAMYGGTACPTRTSILGCAWTPCPNDCKVDKWGDWKPCTKTCGAGGVTFRTRKVIERPTAHAGAPCPQLLQTKQCNTFTCPVDCEQTPWGQAPWGSCSPCTKTCGSGKFSCTRKIVKKAEFGGKTCGVAVKTEACNVAPCPVDCIAEAWSEWSTCTKSCGRGKRRRSRKVLRNTQHGGMECPALKEEAGCNVFLCPIDCTISSWGAYGACSKSCGHGLITRSRSIVTMPQAEGIPCQVLKEHKDCNTHICPVECELTLWGAWSTCSATCGKGAFTRTRQIKVQPEDGGAPCPSTAETKPCDLMACPVDCKTTQWVCGMCHKTCGGGSKLCKREIVQPNSNGGKSCPQLARTVQCNMQDCPIDCELSPWSPPTACSKSCGGGSRAYSKRLYRYPMWGGKACGPTHKVQKCNTQACPIDCQTTPWGSCNECGKTCGGGMHACKRTVMQRPRNGGKSCPAKLNGRFACNTHACPIDCMVSAWKPWTACTKTCGGGTTSRFRTVVQQAALGGKACPAEDQHKKCNHGKDGECPIDCRMSSWGAWSKCSKTCGSGVATRLRQIVDKSTFGGHRCPAWMETNKCNTHACPVDCKVSAWSAWNQCSRSCGGGETFRRKELLVLPANGGKACDANLMERKPCNPHKCVNAVCHAKHVQCHFERGHMKVTHDKLYQKVEGDFKCAKSLGEKCANGLFGNAKKGQQCVFPFEYQGKLYNKCIGNAYGGGGWCSTTNKFTGNWGGCQPCVGCECRCTHHPGCCAKRNYVLKNAMIFANMFQHVGSYTDCCARCTNHPTCGAWEYNSNGVCILKSGKPVLVKTEKQMLQNGYFTYAGERASAASARRCGQDYLEHPAGIVEVAHAGGFHSLTKYWAKKYKKRVWTREQQIRHGVDDTGKAVQWFMDPATKKWSTHYRHVGEHQDADAGEYARKTLAATDRGESTLADAPLVAPAEAAATRR